MCKKCNCDDEQEFDARAAFDELARKHELLAEYVAKYMAEAKKARPARVKNALALSESILISVIGGLPVPPSVSPDCCLVGQVNPSGQFKWYCTGVLIDSTAVLTAAHCVYPEKNMVPNVVALNTSKAPTGAGDAVIIRLAKPPIRHPLYSPFVKTNDIAILQLRESASVVPAKIATSTEINKAEAVRVVGFGSTSPSGAGFGTKRSVDVDIELIRRAAGDNLNEAEVLFGFESDLEFVAGGNGKDHCFGDSGGPAYLENGKVAGLVSRKIKNAAVECGSGGIYTRLDTQIEFIRSVLG